MHPSALWGHTLKSSHLQQKFVVRIKTSPVYNFWLGDEFWEFANKEAAKAADVMREGQALSRNYELLTGNIFIFFRCGANIFPHSVILYFSYFSTCFYRATFFKIFFYFDFII